MERFTKESFAVFQVEGLDARMDAIKKDVQPAFVALGQNIVDYLTRKTGEIYYVHVAQHRRRTVHAPDNTWVAIGRNKRGYKMEAHFQLSLWEDRLFIWLSMIDQPKNKAEMADYLRNHPADIASLPNDFVVSGSHLVSDYVPLADSQAIFDRFSTVKKSEYQIGRMLTKEQVVTTPDLTQVILETIEQLYPLWQALETKNV